MMEGWTKDQGAELECGVDAMRSELIQATF